MNLDDGGALMAFRMRRADGSALWTGGSSSRRPAARRATSADGEVVFTPGRQLDQPGVVGALSGRVAASRRRPARFGVRALLDDQELDSRASTGAIYWEGLSLLLDGGGGAPVGRGYLEMTGYAGAPRAVTCCSSRARSVRAGAVDRDVLRRLRQPDAATSRTTNRTPERKNRSLTASV